MGSVATGLRPVGSVPNGRWSAEPTTRGCNGGQPSLCPALASTSDDRFPRHQEAATMTAIVLPDIDRSTLEELKKRIPDLSELELPNLPSRKEVGRAAKDMSKNADATIDRLLGRSRAPMWPWIAAGVGLVALAGIVAAWFAWFRRPTWEAPAE